LTAGVAASVDTRNSGHVPTSGRFLGVGVWRFVPLDGNAESFTRLALDWRSFRPIHGDRHIVALRLLASTDTSPTRSSAPFYLQYWLGGSQSLRGFPSYRFRGAALAHLSVEYRWRAARYVEIAPFVDVGTVAARVSQLSRAPWKVSPGVGVRIRNDKRMFFRIDWAGGSEGQRVVFSVSPAF
jgi:outer membrane protein assembly factor BamA